MKKLLLLAALLPLAAYAQFGTARRVTVGSSLPATCSVGQIFFRTVTNIGIHECTATDTWTFTRGAIGSVTWQNNGTTVGTRGTFSILPGTHITVGMVDTGTKVEYTADANTGTLLSRATDQAGTDRYCAPSGASGTAYTCNVTPALTAYTTGGFFILKPDVNSGTAPTLAINGLTARNLQKLSAGALANVAANDLDADAAYVIIVMASVFLVVGI